MNSINIIKDSLRIIKSKYVNGKKLDDNSYKITFLYKNRNYSLDINTKYKFIMLSTIESIYGMDINDDTLDLTQYIRQMILYTELETYNVFSFSVRKEIINNELHNILQVIEETDEFGAIIDVEEPVKNVEKIKSETIEYNFGLNKLDKRLFDDEIFEDFNEKVSTLSEEDLYLMYTTLVSYFYKLTNNKWEDEKIDPYIIESMIFLIYNEIQRRLNEQSYYNWFNEWNNYFNNENIEEYLNNRNKDKNKELR